MFIEVIIEDLVERRVHVPLEPFIHFTYSEFKAREALINAYIGELKMLYPKAWFQLAYESRMNLIDDNGNWT
jgi:hypothetical protein